MPSDTTDLERRDRAGVSRRAVLRSAAAVGALAGVTGLASAGSPDDAGRGAGRGAGHGRGGGFPPSGITEYGPAVTLGEGEARTFTTETPAGEPKYHGVELERDALAGLPTADELAGSENQAAADKYSADGQALRVHKKWSLEFFVPFPEAAETPFTFLGLNWNPGGHPPPGVYTVPHFDVHFHMLAPATVDAITGPQPAPYDAIPAERIPEGYVRTPVPAERYITDMGEHLIPADAPELAGGEFTNTLIQGIVAVEGAPRLAFVEPMVTREYLRGLAGVDRRPVPRPETYPTDERYPTSYSVRDVPSKDAIAIVMRDFE